MSKIASGVLQLSSFIAKGWVCRSYPVIFSNSSRVARNIGVKSEVKALDVGLPEVIGAAGTLIRKSGVTEGAFLAAKTSGWEPWSVLMSSGMDGSGESSGSVGEARDVAGDLLVWRGLGL